MPLPKYQNEAPGVASAQGGKTANSDRLERNNKDRSPLRQAQTSAIVKSGPRVALEALLAVSKGCRLDDVLHDLSRIAPEGYHALLYRYAALDYGEAA